MHLSRLHLRLWLRWIVATTAGLVLGLLIGGSIAGVGTENWKLLSAAVGGAVFGVCLATVQMFSMSQHMKLGRWIVAGLLGYSLGSLLTHMAGELFHLDTWVAEQGKSLTFFAVYSGVVSLSVGLPVGIMQWWGSRWGRVSLTGWVLANVAAVGASTFVALFVAWKVNTDQTLSGLEIPAILIPMAGIYSTLSWLPVSRSIKNNAVQSESTATSNIGSENSHSTDE